MNIVILGAGNIAHFFLQQIADHQDLKVVQLYNRHADTAEALCATYHIPLVTDLNQLNPEADVYLFCVKDQAIASLAQQLQLNDSQTAIHCAGSQSLDLLKHTGINQAVVWPLYSINKQGLPRHRNVPMIVEASGAFAAAQALSFARLISDQVNMVSFAQRQYLHLNAVIVNNFTNHLLAVGAAICTEHHLSYELLKPIIRQTIEQALLHNPASIQTGPAIRKDEDTMSKHLGLLSAHPEWAGLYQAISASIEKMYS